MRKLILFASAVVAAAALAIPAAALAIEMRDPNGKVAVGAAITGTSTNAVTTTTALGDLTCAHVLIGGEVTLNGPSTISAKGTSGSAITCFAEQTPLTVTKPTLLSMTTNGGDAGTLTMTFIADVGGFECHFEGTGGFTYGTGIGQDVVHIPGLVLNAPEVCKCLDEEGEPIDPIFHGDFTVTTEANGSGIWIQ